MFVCLELVTSTITAFGLLPPLKHHRCLWGEVQQIPSGIFAGQNDWALELCDGNDKLMQLKFKELTRKLQLNWFFWNYETHAIELHAIENRSFNSTSQHDAPKSDWTSGLLNFLIISCPQGPLSFFCALPRAWAGSPSWAGRVTRFNKNIKLQTQAVPKAVPTSLHCVEASCVLRTKVKRKRRCGDSNKPPLLSDCKTWAPAPRDWKGSRMPCSVTEN